MASPLLKRVQKLETEITIQEAISRQTVIGMVDMDGNLVRSLKWSGSTYEETDESPQAFFPEKIEPVFTRPKRFIILIGGRGSGKSIAVGDIGLLEMHDHSKNFMCIREFQSSIADSVHALLKEERNRLELDGFDITEKAIRCVDNNATARFMGLSRNPESVKSAFGFLTWWIEEAQFLSEKSLRTLTPTARNKPVKGLPGSMVEVGDEEVDMAQVRMIFCGNPASSEDPFSQRFIVPYLTDLDSSGIYEDDMHLIIKMNYCDNPWFGVSGLEQERKHDEVNLPRTTYDWVWNGGFNDTIENALIKPEWFDACIDAHEKLGMKPYGVTKVIHDPSDLGSDPKAVAVRKANIITNVTQRNDIDVNDGNDWALGIAINENADQYEWDVGGMGVTLKRDVNTALQGKHITAHQFNGASSVDNPDGIYESSGASNMVKQKTNKEVCKNLRAQCYLSLRDRVFRTYKAVVNNEFCDPELLISFSSECQNLTTLRAELCRMPIKPNSSGLFELYTKQEMRDKFKLRSPNCADVIMMSERVHVKMIEETPIDNLYVPTKNYW